MAGASAICVAQQARELRKRTLPPDPDPILSAPRITTAPRANNTPTTPSTARCGSRPNKLPATIARTTCTANAAATPTNTWPGRYLVPNTRLANAVLSGSSATKTMPKTVARTARFIAVLSLRPHRDGQETSARQLSLRPKASLSTSNNRAPGAGPAGQHVDIPARSYSPSLPATITPPRAPGTVAARRQR
jgi:hypothetical protein